MDEDKKRRLQELASKESQNLETSNQSEGQTDERHETTQYYTTGEKIGRWIHEWKVPLIALSVLLIFVAIIVGMIIFARRTSTNTVTNNTVSSSNGNLIKSVQEEVIYEKSGVSGLKISTTGDFKETRSEITVDLLFENTGINTETYIFAAGALNHDMYYNECMSMDDVKIYSEKKAIATLYIDKSKLEKAGVTILDQISIAVTTDHWLFNTFASGNINLNGTDTYWNTDKITNRIYDENDVILEQSGLSDGNPSFGIYNFADELIECDVTTISVNDMTYDLKEWGVSDTPGLFSDELVLPGCIRMFVIPVDSRFKSSNRINEINSMDFHFEYTYGATGRTDIYVEY